MLVLLELLCAGFAVGACPSLCVLQFESILAYQAGIKGFYHTSEDEKENAEGKRTYYRVLEVVDASEEGTFDKISNVFETVFHGLAMRALVETMPEEDSACATLINSLRELDNLHFAV